MRLKTFVQTAVLAVAVAVPTITAAAGVDGVSITRVDRPFGDTKVTLSTGHTCYTDPNVRVGPITNYQNGYFWDSFDQNGASHDC
jgi:hypothetical protein